MSLFSFQGKLHTAIRQANGKPGVLTWMGNAPSCQLKLSTETSKKTESFSGNRLQYGELQKGKTAELSITLDEWTPANIAMALYATQIATIAGTVTGELLPPGLIAGNTVRLDHAFVSNLVLTDSAGTPATVAADKYSLSSPNAGLVDLLDVGTFVQPFKAAYSYAAADSFTMLTAAPPERFLLLDGIDTETNEPVLVELWRCKFAPVGQLDLIVDDYGNLPLTGSVLYDPINAKNANLGGFGRITHKKAV